MPEAVIETYRDVDDAWRWRMLGGDGHVLADGATTHRTRDALEEWLDDLRTAIGDAEVVATSGPVVLVEPGWQAVLLHEDGTTVAESTGHDTRDSARSAARRAVEAGALPTEWSGEPGDGLDRRVDAISGATRAEFTPAGFVCHRGGDGEWRWRLRLRGAHVADSGEGYADRATATDHAELTTSALPGAAVRTWG